MAISSSSDTIRDMRSDLQKTMRGIQQTNANIKGAIRATSGWNDAQGQQYRQLMQRVARLTESPANTLNSALPKLDRLAQSLDAYGKIRF